MTKRKGEFDREIESLADIVIDTCGTGAYCQGGRYSSKDEGLPRKKKMSDNTLTVAGCRHTIR